ncbi:CBK_G0011280.mRNA.1.CDS.1 [Saccharomyces cerevisiae]|nr:CBK_G0011280.mRNA.1.CDS.1 [Saccharomyces cerevisiae]CAI7213860.1 CBK_G0011280.mRNA.1.CDS.1 [Saccharomyces cerevisiae]
MLRILNLTLRVDPEKESVDLNLNPPSQFQHSELNSLLILLWINNEFGLLNCPNQQITTHILPAHQPAHTSAQKRISNNASTNDADLSGVTIRTWIKA